MQNKGFVKLIAVLMGLICCFYFSFSFVTSHYEGKAAAMGEQEGRAYLDSLRSENVWLGYNYKRCEELQIGLGLDLKGGMNVILEVSVPDVVRNLAGSNANEPQFKKAFDEAYAESQKGNEDFVDLFVKKFQAQNGQNQLGGIFANSLKESNITPNSTDDQVRAALTAEVKAAVNNSYQVVQQRIDRFGVAQPNIQILEGKGQMGQIMVEMPGIKEPERVRNLLQGSANLEFWETYRASDLQGALRSLDSRMAGGEQAEVAETPAEEAAEAPAEVAEEQAQADTTALFAAKADAEETQDAPKVDAQAQAKAIAEHPLFARLIQGQFVAGDGCVVGLASHADTAAIMNILTSAQARQIMPADVHFAWGVKPSEYVRGNFFELYALKKTNGAPAMAGDVIADAKDDYDQYHRPIVSMTMNTQGGRDWAALTKKNIKRPVAIVLDGFVYSAPVVQNEITGGTSQISGHFTAEDTKDLANVLKSGKMPAPTTIVSEETVGPSLGAASIKAGFISCVVAFVLLMFFMCLIYGFIPGMVANCALLLNFFFTFGVLTSFQAALTMSGIAGLVLSLGMAVDANVLIFERTKEELRAGKNIKSALADGYGNAFSAIFDSNLTSIITAVILYNFGTGPIRGFAMTLGIGICASFFTAVWMTRIVFEHFHNKDKWLNLKFTTSLSEKLLQNTHYHFMSAAKTSFIAFGLFAVVCIASLSTRGLSKGIDFAGGRNYVVEFTEKTASEDVEAAVRASLQKAGSDATVSCLDIVTTSNPAVRISTTYKIDEQTETVDQEVEQFIWQSLTEAKLITADYNTFKDRDNKAGGSIISAQKVGATVAAEMTEGAVKSVLFALAAIFLYILVRFRNVAFSIGSVAALCIDTLLIIGMYSLCWGWVPFSLEIDQTFIAAVLTAIGYSINDKVVVFDRIRENLGLYPKRDSRRLFNESINSTLCRTIMTSVTTLIVLLCIFFLGGDSIRSFAFAMILGVLFGTCSSIFLAAPIALRTLGKQKVVEAGEVEA
ncbi:MAG: protein translocase subunit SecDF [Bacteroidaceae bacterium]|nr:protein translocase subunit SecDF [Bacteroidaceae bacterium]